MRQVGSRKSEVGVTGASSQMPAAAPRLRPVIHSPTSDFRLPTSHFQLGPAGLTLAELVIVLTILTIVGSLVLPAAGRYVADSREALTRQSLTRLRDVIAETYWQDNDRSLPRPTTITTEHLDYPQLRYLFINPTTETAAVTYDYDYARGWRGPYLVFRDGAIYTISSNTATGFTSRYGLTGDPTVLDAWGHPIVLQNPGSTTDGLRQDVRLVSAGPDGIIQTDPDTATSALTTASTGDDVWLPFEVRP